MVEDMFDDHPGPATGSFSAAPPATAGDDDTAGVLAADRLGEVRAGLSHALGGQSGLDDAGRVDAIRALEELVCVATAAQASLAAELDTSVRATEADAGLPAAHRGRGVAAQLALARRESPHRGRRHLGLATIIATELPCTWAAWRTGRTTEWRATLIARETACLTLEARREVDRLLAADPDRLEAMGDREVERTARAHADRLDPAAATARRRKAHTERSVTIRPAPDTMTYLTALLPVADGVAAHATLTRAAEAARAAGDPRTKGQVMADTLRDAILGTTETEHVSTEPAPAATSRPRPPVSLGLVMSDTTLFGTSEDPAHLDGYGPIPAELARELIAEACTDHEKIWLRRLYTHPTTGELATLDATGRTFRGTLARFIRLRDQTCRTPWCDAPVRHLDHATDASRDGPTTATNGQGLCEACNHAKQAPGWRARPTGTDGHQIQTTTPTGHTHHSRPPTLATIHHRRPIHIDYVLAG
jgi:hypothetical protein